MSSQDSYTRQAGGPLTECDSRSGSGAGHRPSNAGTSRRWKRGAVDSAPEPPEGRQPCSTLT